MKAIEIETTANDKGLIEIQLAEGYKNKKVRVIILTGEDIGEDEWLHAISANPAFNFLNDPGEDIYTLNDGKPFKS